MIYRALDKEGLLRVRIYALMYAPGLGAELDRILAIPPSGGPGSMLTVRAIKVYADGALGARGARLLEPYADASGERGQWANKPEDLAELVLQASRAGYQVGIHAIGDAGNRAALDAAERARTELDRSDLRVRIEHAQVISAVDIPRFGALGVIASMQPIHATMDMGFAESRLGPERIAGAYAWRSLLDHGARIVASADTPAFPVYYSDPIVGLHAAVSRQDRHGHPKGGWKQKQRVSVHEALAMYTRDAAFAAFAETEIGTLSSGKIADITVLSADPSQVRAEKILDLTVEMTLVGGRIEYRRKP